MVEVTARFGLPLLVAGQGQKDITHNEALVLVDALACPVVESRTLSVPPVGPNSGECWLVPTGASGDWLGKDSQLAVWTSGGWRFLPAPEGFLVFVKAEALELRRIAGAWQVLAPKAAPAEPISLPVGGAVIDAEARAVIAGLASRLQQLGLLAP